MVGADVSDAEGERVGERDGKLKRANGDLELGGVVGDPDMVLEGVKVLDGE